MDSQRVKTPFENLEREKLQSWSKFAKEKGILDGYQRKVIYEAGKYDNIFLSRLSKLNSALRDLEEHLEQNEEDVSYEIRSKGYRLYLDTKAEAGDPMFQNEVGDAYRWGLFGYEVNEKKAIYWFEKASEQGYLEATNTYADYLVEGIHIKKDHRKAAFLYEAVSDAGYFLATFNFALCFLEGIGVKQSNKEAFKYMEIAAKKGVDEAQERLGCMYYDGDIVEQDFEAAIRWLERSAKQKNSHACYVLGLCHLFGNGCEESPANAFDYFTQGHLLGSVAAQYRLGICYLLGDGCEQDGTFGFQLIDEAYDNGVTQAA